MKKVFIILIVALMMLVLVVVPAVAAPPTTVTVSWDEDGHRYNPDDTDYDVSWNPWTCDSNGPMELAQTGKVYHVVDINQYYNPFGPANKTGHMIIKADGRLSGQAEYISSFSGLRIRDRFEGNITSDLSTGVWEGTYTQYSYAWGTEEDVKAKYPEAIPADPDDPPESGEAGWWFLFYTEYSAPGTCS